MFIQTQDGHAIGLKPLTFVINQLKYLTMR